ncbi:hypothetical protein AAFF_G00189140 [Aldrovandia affinis]|uniref:Uncharacterized protein n=1 Tax=Aldrovandia affinis TaxID=143900 RepID=A0AAD7RKB4_9TELE|nr:hypothetical protein AAFF_G00189140 [Aldrovandia affinis]
MFLYLLGLVAFLFLYRWYRERERVGNNSDKYVYITGCDSGFGNLLARRLDKLGFCVIASCLTEKGEELRKTSSERMIIIHLDITKAESVDNAAALVKTQVGEKGLWAVVNNAGVSLPSAPCDWLTLEDYKSLLDVNLNGLIAVTLSVLPLIKKARGRVVNVASVAGRICMSGGPYPVSKYGVEAFNDSLRINMLHFGVKVLCIEPGAFRTSLFDTDILARNMKKLWDRLPQEIKVEYGRFYVDKVITKLRKCEGMIDGDLMKVVSCMEHAISAVHPRTRYSPGWDAKLLWLPLSYMPTFIADYLFLKVAVKPHKSVI